MLAKKVRRGSDLIVDPKPSGAFVGAELWSGNGWGPIWGPIWENFRQGSEMLPNVAKNESGKDDIGLVWGRHGSVWAETCCGKRYWAQVSL